MNGYLNSALLLLTSHDEGCVVMTNLKPWFRNHLEHTVNVRYRLFRKAKRRDGEEDLVQYRKADQQGC
jgi:hypothetical protein